MLTSALAQDYAVSPAEKILNCTRPLVIAHRGYSEIAPENSLPAFQLAKAAGADLVELDYYHTKDEQMVVIHDGTLDRTTDAVARWGEKKIPVKAKTLAELKLLDAGKWFAPQFTGTILPTLSEALDVIQKDGGITLIERKEGDAATCVKLLQSRKEVNQLIVHAFDWKYLADFHALEPTQVLEALGPPGTWEGKKLTDPEKVLNLQFLTAIKQIGCRAVGWNNQVTKESVQQAHALGLKVWIYTVNKAAEADYLLDMGVDGIITNNPALIWRTMALRQSRGDQPLATP